MLTLLYFSNPRELFPGGNSFQLGIPSRWEDALEFIFSHPSRPVDTGLVNDRLFLNECGTGFDVLTLEYALEARKRIPGVWSYLFGIVRAIVNFRPIEMHLEIDDDLVMDGKYMVCAIGNGSYIGGGIPITPCAKLYGGEFDILMVDAVPNWQIPFYLPALMMGTLYKKKRVAHRYTGRKCTLRSKNMRLNVDGEIHSAEEATFQCEEDALLLHW